MATITQDLGKVAYLSKGAYSSSTQYEKNDVVTYEGSSYVSLQSTQGNVPTNATYWQLLAEKGTKGDTGATGASNELTIGTISSGASASATITGTSPNQVLNLVLPKGDKGDQGMPGEPSGTPLVASSISGMTDTSKVYVNTSDGNWYYYDGSSWQIGGTYQSIRIADNSVTYDSLDSTLQKNLESVGNTTEFLPISNKYVDDTGHILDNNNFYCYEIEVNPFEIYVLDIVFEGYAYGNNAPLYCFKNNNTFISKLSKADAIESGVLVNNHFHVVIDIPYNANKLLINSHGPSRNYILTVDEYRTKNIHKEQLDAKLQSIFDDDYNDVEPTLVVNGAYIEGLSSIQAVSGYSIYSYDVEPGEKYKLSVKQFYNNPYLVFSTNNSTISKTINSETYTFKTFVEQEKSSTSTIEINDFEFTVPEYCNKIYINKQNSSNLFSLKKSTSYLLRVEDIDLDYIKNNLNPLNQKTILFTGDSITSASTTGVKGWWRLIAENNPTANVYNYGVDGATISVVNDNPTKNVVSYIQTMHSEHADADYIIIEGGVNDFYKLVSLGTFNSTGNYNGETAYDTSTFSGALEWIFHYCLTNFSGKKIGYIVTHKVASYPNFKDYMDRAKEICKKWSIPFIDLYEESDLNFNVTYHKENYSITTVNPNGDGLHPNLNGYKIITPKIENWLKYKI